MICLVVASPEDTATGSTFAAAMDRATLASSFAMIQESIEMNNRPCYLLQHKEGHCRRIVLEEAMDSFKASLSSFRQVIMIGGSSNGGGAWGIRNFQLLCSIDKICH